MRIKQHTTNKYAYRVPVLNKTMKTLSTGVTVPTALNMQRRALKI